MLITDSMEYDRVVDEINMSKSWLQTYLCRPEFSKSYKYKVGKKTYLAHFTEFDLKLLKEMRDDKFRELI